MELPTIQLPTVKVPANVEETVERVTTAIRNFELSKFEMPIDLPNVDLPEMPKFDMPKFDMPKFELPDFEMPKFEMPKFEGADADRVVDFARDAAYVGVGVAVVTVQKADERRRELTDTVTGRVRQLVDAIA